MFRSCLILIFVLFSPVLLFSKTGFLALSLLPAGRYKSYYPSGKSRRLSPGDQQGMRQIKDVFPDGREEYYESDELYVWKRLE
ncbi:MAG: hypothetical protein JXA95_14865 [Spirochaetales bacterium]|nr:hypothetical protein [Spirochaetales bacterium]